ncbi:MAG: alkaline phosphatase family protein [Bacteroidia bacterium]|nr:alkaline phosphatase family protein [Bacteroidia bacterium]
MKSKLVLLFLSLSLIGFSQNNPKPKLVVGIVVDQMRTDYIYRYWSRFGEGGFKRLVNDGFFCKNTHYNYVPTYTGPGHSSIYTGAAPNVHGIIANDWFVKETGGETYCVSDEKVKPIGTTSKNGKMSPHKQLTTTLGDELKLFTNGKSKVYGVALKDRSSVLPVGHAGNAAFWFDEETGNFVSSDWYVKELPLWLNNFNAKKLPKSYLEKGWNTLYGIETYTNSIADDNKYEKAPNKKEKPVFPYDYKSQIEKNSWGILKATPWGNTITKDIAIECLKNESMGKDDISDMLCISFSSTDYVGHSYGLRAVETEDVYLRLDKDLEELLKTLDAEVGQENYVVFLTADHGAADVAAYLKDLKIPAGYLKEKNIEKELKSFCKKIYGDSLIVNMSNQQVFLSYVKLTELKLNSDEVEKALANKLIQMEGISEAYPSSVLKFEGYKGDSFKSLIANGYNHKRSGNVAFSYMPGWLDIPETGTTHGSEFTYDTHVPLIFYGAGIKKGESVRNYYITEVAPTISILLNNPFPNGCTSKPIEEVFKK